MRVATEVGERPVRGVRGAGGETIKAAVFDLDGTLANTLPAISKLLIKVASSRAVR